MTYSLLVDDVEQRGLIQTSETEARLVNRTDAREQIDSLLKPPVPAEEEIARMHETWGMGNEQADRERMGS